MAELPQILFSEAFELIPISHEFKKGKIRKIVRINLFSDFILINEDNGVQCQLLYPPMPLSHISIESRLDLLELKLSPFKMLLLQPDIASNGKKLIQLYDSLMKNPFISPVAVIYSHLFIYRKRKIMNIFQVTSISKRYAVLSFGNHL